MTVVFGACPCCGIIGTSPAPTDAERQSQVWIDAYNEGYTVGERSAAARVEWALKEERAKQADRLAAALERELMNGKMTVNAARRIVADLRAAIEKET